MGPTSQIESTKIPKKGRFISQFVKPKTSIRSLHKTACIVHFTTSEPNSVCRSNLGLNFPIACVCLCDFFCHLTLLLHFFGFFLHILDHHHHRRRHQTWGIFHLCCNCIISYFALESGRKTEHSKFITYIQ